MRVPYSPQVKVPNVPGTYINDNAGRIVAAAGQSFAAEVSAFGAALKKQEQQQLAVQKTEALKSLSNFEFEQEQKMLERAEQSPPNQSNFFEIANDDITNDTNQFLVNLDPQLQETFAPQLTEFGNRLRGTALKIDREKKSGYFKTETESLINQQSIRLDRDPGALDQARTQLETFVDSTDLSATEKAELLAKGEKQLATISYSRTLMSERSRDDSWVETNAEALVPTILGVESALVGVSRQQLAKVEVINAQGEKPPEMTVDLGARSALAMTGAGIGAVYVGGEDGKRSTGLVLTRAGKQVTPEQDPELYAQFLTNAAAQGFTGFGYDTWGVVIGYGKETLTGPDGGATDPRFVAAIERGKRKYASATVGAATSSADGPAQIVDGTWDAFMRANHPEIVAELGGVENTRHLRKNAGFAREGAAWYLKKVGGALRGAGLPINDGSLYLGYFLGEGGVVSLMKAPANGLASDYLSPGAVRANRSILEGKSVQQVRDWAARKVGQEQIFDQIDDDPRYASVDYTTRMQLRKDAEEQAALRERERVKQLKAEREAGENEFLVSVYDGAGSRQQFESLREKGLFSDYDSIQKVESAFKKREAELEDGVRFAAIAAGSITPNSSEPKDKAALNAAGKAVAEPLIKARDPQAATAIQNVIEATQGTLAPSNAINQLKTLAGAGNAKDALYAFGQLRALREQNGAMIDDYLGEETLKRLSLYNPELSEEQNATILGIGEGAQQRRQRVQLVSEADDLLAEMRKAEKLKPDEIVDKLFGNIIWSNPTVDGLQKGAITAEYEQFWREGYVASNGNVEAAEKYAGELVQRNWGVTDITGQSTVMKYPPSKVPSLSFVPTEYLAQQIRTDLRMEDDHTFQLIGDEQTRRELDYNRQIREGKVQGEERPVSYVVATFNAEGLPISVSNPRNANSRFAFDTREIKEWNEEETRKKILRDQWYMRKGYGDNAPSTFATPVRNQMGLLTADRLPPELQSSDSPQYKRWQEEEAQAEKQQLQQAQQIRALRSRETPLSPAEERILNGPGVLPPAPEEESTAEPEDGRSFVQRFRDQNKKIGLRTQYKRN